MAIDVGPYIVSAGLVAYWDAGNTKSYSGDSSTWTTVFAPKYDATMYTPYDSDYGGSFVFDGTSTVYGDLGSDTSFTTGDQYTFEVVFRTNKIPTGTGVADLQNFTGLTSATENIHYFTIRARKMAIWNINTTGGGAGVTWYSSLTNIDADTNYHVTLTCDAGNYEIFLNGESDSAIPYLGTQNNNCAFRYFGRFASDREFDGNIYYVKVYDRVLTDAEILENFEMQKNRFRF